MEKNTPREKLLATITVLKDLYKQGYFYNELLDEPNIPQYTFNKLMTALENNTNPFAKSGSTGIKLEVSLVKPNSSEAGLNLCVRCGTVYNVTPQEDAYYIPDGSKSGKVCKSCLRS